MGLVPWRRARAWTWWGQGGAERQVIEVGQRQARGDRRAGGPVPGLTPPGRLPRVHGSYEQLWAGQVADALVDLTGGLAERWNLKDVAGSSGQQDRPRGAERRTCRQLLSLKDRCLLSCSVLGPRTGRVELSLRLSPHCLLPELCTQVLLGLSRERTSVLRAGVPFPPDRPSPEGSIPPSLDQDWPPG